MSLAEHTQQGSSTSRSRVSTTVALLAAALVGAFVLTSALISVAPEFRFESQFPALLPFFAWGAAAGVGHLANLGQALALPWRRTFGLVSLVPYVLVLGIGATVPQLRLPWWAAAVAAASAMVPFVVLAGRAGTGLALDPAGDADDASRRGTFLVGVALMLLAYAVAGPTVVGAVVSVLLAIALSVAGMMTHGLARASRTWRLGHWVALAWGSMVVWASALLHGLTSFFGDPWNVFSVVVLAGLPLVVANAADARRSRG